MAADAAVLHIAFREDLTAGGESFVAVVPAHVAAIDAVVDESAVGSRRLAAFDAGVRRCGRAGIAARYTVLHVGQ